MGAVWGSFFYFLFVLWKGGHAHAPARETWLVHAPQPQLPIPAVLSVPSVLFYNTREAPYVRYLSGVEVEVFL